MKGCLYLVSLNMYMYIHPWMVWPVNKLPLVHSSMDGTCPAGLADWIIMTSLSFGRVRRVVYWVVLLAG